MEHDTRSEKFSSIMGRLIDEKVLLLQKLFKRTNTTSTGFYCRPKFIWKEFAHEERHFLSEPFIDYAETSPLMLFATATASTAASACALGTNIEFEFGTNESICKYVYTYYRQSVTYKKKKASLTII